MRKEYYELDCFQQMNFSESEMINLTQRYSDYYGDGGVCFVPAAALATWKQGEFDNILKKIADDETRVIFAATKQRIIVSPYDGGVDCIVENSDQVSYHKNRYQDWISRLESEL